jgi:uncharacterized membrane protein YGL010W
MKTLDQWLADYGESHTNRANKLIHWICVPAILFSILGLLWLVPVPAAFAALGPWANWATAAMALAVVYYAVLSPTIAVGMAFIALVMFTIIARLQEAGVSPLWAVFVGIFVVAWIGQFIGHHIEGKRPSFFKDLQFLLIGPAWLMAAAYRRAPPPTKGPEENSMLHKLTFRMFATLLFCGFLASAAQAFKIQEVKDRLDAKVRALQSELSSIKGQRVVWKLPVDRVSGEQVTLGEGWLLYFEHYELISTFINVVYNLIY